MKAITLHTIPSDEVAALSQDAIVSKLQPNGRFTDEYVGELIAGDQVFIPQNELPPASDTEILDYLISGKGSWSWTISDFVTGESAVHAFKVEDLSEIGERRFKTGDTPAMLGAFRELVTELIHEQEL